MAVRAGPSAPLAPLALHTSRLAAGRFGAAGPAAHRGGAGGGSPRSAAEPLPGADPRRFPAIRAMASDLREEGAKKPWKVRLGWLPKNQPRDNPRNLTGLLLGKHFSHFGLVVEIQPLNC